MPITYSYGNAPAVSSTATAAQQRDAVRFLIGDKVCASDGSMQLSDEEVAFLLAQEMNVYMAAGRACEVLAMKRGSVKTKKVGDLMLEFSVAELKSLAASYFARGMTYQIPSVGGISRSEKEVLTTDTDWLPALFSRRMHENPGGTTDLEMAVEDRTIQ